jgi:hypothetical protein
MKCFSAGGPSFAFLAKDGSSQTRKIHNPHVTSDLVPLINLARSWLRSAGHKQPQRPTSNSFVPKILSCKLFAIKILQTFFAECAPSKTFGG